MSGTPVVSAIAATVGDVASILEGIQTIAGVLNTPRSVVLAVENYTKRRLTRILDNHVNGGFAVTPSTIIAAGGVNIYGSQNKAMAIGTGTEGTVRYQLEGDENWALGIYWNNPFIGENKCSAFVGKLQSVPGGLPPMLIPDPNIKFRAAATCGAGDQGAEMRFELLKNE